MAGKVVSLAEANAAKTFLAALGIRNPSNAVIAAVVTWMVAESGGLSKVIGNNPFNLRPGFASQYASGTRTIGYDPRTGEPIQVLKFSSLTKGLQAAAYYLAGTGAWKNVVNALKQGNVIGFLSGIAKYSTKYGYTTLWNMFKQYTAVTQPPVQQPQQPAPAPTPAPTPPTYKFPRFYKQLAPPAAPLRQYLDGYRADSSYRARHRSWEDDVVS